MLNTGFFFLMKQSLMKKPDFNTAMLFDWSRGLTLTTVPHLLSLDC